MIPKYDKDKTAQMLAFGYALRFEIDKQRTAGVRAYVVDSSGSRLGRVDKQEAFRVLDESECVVRESTDGSRVRFTSYRVVAAPTKFNDVKRSNQ